MTLNSIFIKILLIPLFHGLISILLVGVGLYLLVQERLSGKNSRTPGTFLSSVGLGILYNTLQFILVLSVYRKFPVSFQKWMGVGKYSMDAAFLLFIFLVYKKKYWDLLKRSFSVFTRWENAVLLLFSLFLGVLAILNFPHVHDSGQLMVTNGMLLKGNPFLAAGRYGLGFSAMLYFPAAVFPGIPMATLAGGFKLFLLLLTGLAVIYGVDILGTVSPAVSKFLYFFIILSSYFGLCGLMELGKDSAWAVLFSLIFIFSCLGGTPMKKPVEACLFFLCAVSLGMIAIPYLCIFCTIFFFLRLLPERISSHRIIFPAAILLMLGISSRLMPVKLAIPLPQELHLTSGKAGYWSPTEGKTSFFRYFFALNKKGYKNSTPMVVFGLLGILMLPLMRERFKQVSIRSLALFLPVATFVCLFIAFLGRNFVPAGQQEKIPFTPFTTFNAWDLVKDIPQWYVQIVGGIFFILLLDEAVKKISAIGKTRKTIYFGSTVVASLVLVSANFSRFISLKNPAHFYSYGGNKEKNFALVMETIHRHPKVNQILLMKRISGLSPVFFVYDIRNYFPWKKVRIIATAEAASLLPFIKKAFFLIADKHSLADVLNGLHRRGCMYKNLPPVYFENSDEGIYLLFQPRVSSSAPGHNPAQRNKI